ncbi:hypothetical protein CC78DRAFT_564563 [Lojkania enalia]|uniref:Uncharacterized protein n=1 Tax=Lojkania enalia TaxID=147567 RepID=A0A9P4TQY5_9PLEO|nr:hypothetical protein CC78DRAFT_564563 [Didymosphaeria enalia]
MATIKPNDAPPPEQPKALPAAHTLDQLQAMMNLVLVQSGRYIKEIHRGDAYGRQQFQFKRAIPAAHERFQDSLDELENELHLSQAVLRRDLALLQADRLKREQAEAAERQRLAAESSAKKKAPVKTEEPAADPKDTSKQAEAATQNDQKASAEPEAAKTEAKQPPAIDPSASQPDPLFDPTPTTANLQDNELDFDAIFDDSALGLPADGSGDVNMDGPDLGFNLDDSGPSLLRGLEDFAKSGDDTNTQINTNMDLDFPIPELPDSTIDQPTAEPPNVNKPAESSTGQLAAEPEMTDNAANDLFDAMVTDSMDDLFNLDNDMPEHTQFDNAFFGFED